MTTRMVHSEHGATHAYDTGEIARLENLGWSVEKPVPFVPPIVVMPLERQKPGPKPKAK